jgi:acetyl-CoA carboxylase beta subunit
MTPVFWIRNSKTIVVLGKIVHSREEVNVMKQCPNCKKILFKKKDGTLACPNECDRSGHRTAFSTVIDPMLDRRIKETFDPWSNVK